jgi:hypothetical protein
MLLKLAHLGKTILAMSYVRVVRRQLSKWYAMFSAKSHGGLMNTRSPLKSLSKTKSLGEQ